MIEKTAEYMRRHEDKSFVNVGGGLSTTLPLIMGGDLNSLPVSSVLSAFMFEDLEDPECSWKFPEDLPENIQDKYKSMNKKYKKKKLLSKLEPIEGKLQSAYTFYQLPPGESEYNSSMSRDQTMPEHTNYT